MNLWLPIGSILLTVILGVVYQTHHFDKRFDDLKEHNKDLNIDLNRRIDDLEKRLVDRIERLEHPVHRG